MRKMTLLPCLFLALALSATSWADDYLKVRHVSEAYEVMGQKQPASEEIVETWLSQDMARMNTGSNSSVILRGDKQVMYILDHAEKTYAEMPLDMARAMSDMMTEQGADEETRQMMAQMMGAMMQVQAEVRDTGETRQVGEWDCRMYSMTLKMPMGDTLSEICASDQIDVDQTLYHKLGNAMMAGQQGFAEMMREMEKIKGVSVLTINTASVMGTTVTSREELLEHKKMSPPAGSFEVPAGYTKQNFMGM